MGMTYARIKQDNKKLLALTGLTRVEFERLLEGFIRVSEPNELLTSGGKHRQRKPGGGRKATLKSDADRLVFILVYLKTYPLQEVMSELFDMEVSKVNEWIHRLLPVVRDALDELGVMPERNGAVFAQDQAQRDTGKDIIIDGTERRRQRPKDPEKQALHYSGKKKTHTDKNIVIADRKTKRVSYLSKTYAGTAHDKKIADHEAIAYAQDTVLHQDTGFQGYQPERADIHQPKKSPAHAS